MEPALLRMSDVPDVVEELTGERPHLGTVHKWRKRGIAGVRLDCSFAMGCYRTSRAALVAFFDRIAVAKAGGDPDTKAGPVTLARLDRDRELSRVEDELFSLGC
ncbi:hypothetical protein LF1_48570 [Rubripirellula obstinata]|uniref:Uncharacterized protein n=1 Tax=Rubripirellula obstinata TaxID=406547 RepID=A0A5B1CSD0_9BACT|nr:hypothetical protein [Rubripirellula obstinata]KAA1262293.1 hypothetical protein LF1_48570 [Rubripirellula obstinata]